MMKTHRFSKGWVWLFSLVFLLSGCKQTFTRQAVWIDVPQHNKVFSEGESIHIEGHAADKEQIQSVQIWINGEFLQSVSADNSGDNLFHFEFVWLPPSAGDYELKTIAINSAGEESKPDSVRFQVGQPISVVQLGETLQEISPTIETPTLEVMTPSDTPEPSHTPQTLVMFYAEPQKISAGQCSMLYWRVENAQQVIFGGSEQNFEGQFQTCLCETQYYPLTVTYLDGREERFTVSVEVTGSCETPTVSEITLTPTVSDTTPPPAPVLLKPVNGISLSCSAYTTVMWEAVTDPSGISQYHVDVQRHSGDLNWQSLTNSPFGGLGTTQYSVPVQCGWIYRWRVRAVDGAGNIGNWSDWFTFTIPLT